MILFTVGTKLRSNKLFYMLRAYIINCYGNGGARRRRPRGEYLERGEQERERVSNNNNNHNIIITTRYIYSLVDSNNNKLAPAVRHSIIVLRPFIWRLVVRVPGPEGNPDDNQVK